MTTALRDVQAALQRKTGFELLDANEEENQLRVLGRVIQDKMGLNLKNWLLVAHGLLLKSGKTWAVDISKQYFVRNGKVVYAWRLIFQGEGIKAQYDSILASVMETPHTSRGELMEFPLSGTSLDRNELRNRKGASPVRG